MGLPHHVSHLVRTAALLESRADRYAGYLVEVLRPRGWTAALEQWGREEATHGESLRAWLAEHEPTFEFAACMDRYAALPYHDAPPRGPDGGHHGVYGSTQGELVARCVVEAMAAAYYQALAAAAVDQPSLHQLCRRLAADEARHFSLFSRMLGAVRRDEGMRRGEALTVVLRRLAAQNDEQIVYASYVVGGGRGAFDLRVEGRRYRAMVLRVFGRRQARFVGALLTRVLVAPEPRRRAIAFAPA
jgi:rubrerythrin